MFLRLAMVVARWALPSAKTGLATRRRCRFWITQAGGMSPDALRCADTNLERTGLQDCNL